jgi:hypothetical protein
VLRPHVEEAYAATSAHVMLPGLVTSTAPEPPEAVPPLPSWPMSSRPQHQSAAPPAARAHAKSYPALTLAAPASAALLPAKSTGWGVGVEAVTEPSCPSLLPPLQAGARGGGAGRDMSGGVGGGGRRLLRRTST